MRLHPSTYEYLKPTDAQIESMAKVRAAAKAYSDVLEAELPDGPDKTYVMRRHRSTSMWCNVAITRLPDGTPRP
jgi:methylmalonyl-CoA mutase N-terminal domain/subunit